MQSLRGARWEGAGSRCGRVVRESETEEEELEEGEARSDSDDDGVDPDVALSYIDEKLQHVLGHFQKEFEGEVSVQNLGSKFGGYGSFLPTYQHSPLLPQSESPHIAANISTSGSPYQPSAERMDQNPCTVVVEPTSRNNGSGAPSASDLLKKKKCPGTSDEESIAGSDSLNSSFSGSDSKSLKFQTKVCLNNDLPRENAVIYSGPGLDISSPSSMEESPDGILPYESPRTILQVMTCFPVPGGFLLSPLRVNLLQLRNKVAPVLKDRETYLDMENVSRALEGRSQSFHPPGPIRGNVAKQMKPCSKKKVSMNTNTRKIKADASAIMNKEVNIQVPASQNEKMMNTNNESSYSDEEGIVERNKAHPKVKSKIGIDQDEQITYKRTKFEDWHQIDRGQDHKCDSDGAEIHDLGRSFDNSLLKASWREDLTVNDTGVGRGDRQLYSGDKRDFNMEGHSLLSDQHSFDRRATTLNTESGPVQHESKNIEVRQGSGTAQRLGMSFKKEKNHLRIDDQDPVNQVAKLPLKEGKQKVCPTSVKSDSLKMKAKSVRFNVETGVQHGTVKQSNSSTLDTSPVRKDGSMITFALKEARDLKHKANDLKNKGQKLKSTGLYFEAALKFLHVAFLLETPTFDISRPGDGARSMKMYSETAKLCNFCAYEYERCKNMAAAALAYKCVEVAYLKAAYYKHRSASKDRQELQAAVQIARGESPSSSAPDSDNLNSYGLSKASLKGVNSPHVPGNHLPLAVHNQAHLLRLLAYTNEVNLAFNATRKAEFVIASAAGSQEKGGVDDGLASVKTVLDLNFNNVNELLRLVRVSMESISS